MLRSGRSKCGSVSQLNVCSTFLSKGFLTLNHLFMLFMCLNNWETTLFFSEKEIWILHYYLIPFKFSIMQIHENVIQTEKNVQ